MLYPIIFSVNPVGDELECVSAIEPTHGKL